MEILVTFPSVMPPDGDITRRYGNSGFLTLLLCNYQQGFIFKSLFTVDANIFL